MKNFIEFMFTDVNGQSGTKVQNDKVFRNECINALNNYPEFVTRFMQHSKCPSYINSSQLYDIKNNLNSYVIRYLMNNGGNKSDIELHLFVLQVWSLLHH
jgi:hypothetical protein